MAIDWKTKDAAAKEFDVAKAKALDVFYNALEFAGAEFFGQMARSDERYASEPEELALARLQAHDVYYERVMVIHRKYYDVMEAAQAKYMRVVYPPGSKPAGGYLIRNDFKWK